MPRASNGQRPPETSVSHQTSSPQVTDEILGIEDRVKELQLRGSGGPQNPFFNPYSSRSSPIPTRYNHNLVRHHDDSPTPYHPASGLIGGASSPSPSHFPAPIRVPPTLYFLAGGTGRRPITTNTWKKQRGTRRFGGLVGMAVLGGRAGTIYGEDERSGGVCRTDMESVGEHGDIGAEERERVSGSPSRMGSSSSVAGRSSSSSRRTGMDIGSLELGSGKSSGGSSRSSGTARSRTGSMREGSIRARSVRSTQSTRGESVAASIHSAAPSHQSHERGGPAEELNEAAGEEQAGSVRSGQDEGRSPSAHRDGGSSARARA